MNWSVLWLDYGRFCGYNISTHAKFFVMNTLSAQQKSNEFQQVMAPHSLGYRLKLLSQLAARRFQDQLEPFGLTPFHWVVLCCLWREDGLATSQIGCKLQQVGGTLTGVIDRMEERGLIVRQRDPQDRRIVRVWLTEEGKQFQKILPPLALELREQLMLGMTDPERDRLSALIDRAITNLS
jgi:MarR family transcriptional regulator, organic hydroperoxide resistance regulator